MGLPGRRNLVLSRQGDLAPKGAEAFCEVQQMLDAAGEDAFVIGGAQVYRLLLPVCRRLYVTQIDADGGADVFFPEPAPGAVAHHGAVPVAGGAGSAVSLCDL